MNKDYVSPAISGELGQQGMKAAGERNVYAHGTHAPVLCDIDGLPVVDLVAQFGSPLFVFSERDLREKARRLKRAFDSRYPTTSFAWSYKTNYLNAICAIFRDESWMAEVVSDFEYEKARKLGFSGDEIVFNGPHKPRAILETAIREGALIQIDNWDEMNLVEDLAKHAAKPIDVGIRIWLDAGIRPLWSKFGFALATGEAERAAVHVVKNPNLRLHTLHTHIGTYILAPEAYRIATLKLVALREQIMRRHSHLIPCLNLGGGFPSRSLLYGMSGPADQAVPAIEAYADAIADVLNTIDPRHRPHLRLESGRCLVDEAGYLLTTIVALKGVGRPDLAATDLTGYDHKERLILSEDAKHAYVVDAGINLLYTGAWYQFDVRPARVTQTPLVATRLYGSLCMAIDVIRDNVDLPLLEAGDILTLHPVGAYNFTQSMQFINYRPAVVLVGDDGKPEIIRARETLDDIQRPERMPRHLLAKKVPRVRRTGY